ncbi:glycogen operon protein [Roseiarcus fermentans]|uniref:4-alpha-glucanotransferase n=1 Tax=Roseiarcus fermentans TaxID=1473586 RepID=A0A366FD79_9HYPH|nr:glycogen debranching protein GlgX [Roseiarcus fermentans]RBP11910.1 glycogen operon protein [Roseiarcus fermentans]
MSADPINPGVAVTAEGLSAALDLPNAEGVLLCLFDGDRETARIPLARGGDGMFRGLAPGVGAGARYGFRVSGPFEPNRGHRFDVSKLLADPYAVAFDGPFRLDRSMFAFGEDSGAHAPKAIAGAARAGEPGRRRVAPEALVVYELNLRGFTRLHPGVPEPARGTFAGLAHPALIDHLSALGVTAVEIMPADAFVDERHLGPLGLANAWGYNPVVFGAPDPRLAPGGWAEVRAATDALHAAGMEAILDVVFNHNGESDAFGPTLSFRGLDNATFFRLDPSDPARYVNDAGTGNCVALDRPIVVAMAVGALRRWMEYGGIDGFRFDLAVALGRTADGFDPAAPFFRALAADAIVSKARLIAEPWDIGPGGYQLGRFGREWAEWNDRYRDCARRFWRGDAGVRGDLATRISGSRDVFGQGPAPSRSVNFIVAHDGFTLADLVAYDGKHNDGNGEHNRDGTDANYSWNHGVEGPSADPAIVAARTRDQRNLLALLLASRGTPMLAMGSELGFTQSGNNNAYAQDNATTAIHWDSADESLARFVGRLVRARRAHPALSRDAFLTGKPFDATGLPDVEWRDDNGPMSQSAWNDPAGPVLVAVFAAPADGGVDRVALALNRAASVADVRLPAPRAGMAWRIVVDTDAPDAPERMTALADRCRVAARATLVLAERPTATGAGRPPSAETIDALCGAVGLAGDWWDLGGRRTVVSAESKIALLGALGLATASEAQARESLRTALDETRRRRVPPSLLVREGEAASLPLRDAAGAADARIECEDGEVFEWRTPAGDGVGRPLADGVAVVERKVPLPDLPLGRHRLIVDGVDCALTVAPPQCHGAEFASGKRFGVTAQLYALRHERDQGIGDFTALAQAAAAAGGAGAAYFGVSPMHMLFPGDRERASPYYPSDRRFLDPILIDVFDPDLPRDAFAQTALAALAPAAAKTAAARLVDYPEAWRVKRAALEALHGAFARLAAAQPGDSVVADYRDFVAHGGQTLKQFAAFQAIAAGEDGEHWRLWPAPLRDGDPGAIAKAIDRRAERYDFALFCQWAADRQLARAAETARAGGLGIGFYRDLAVGSAPDGAEAWAQGDRLTRGATVGAPPDPFSLQGQNWSLPAPNPLAGARQGWAELSALYAANMRHAGMLRIDHAMGLQRLFLIPDGAKPAEGAYLSYPLDDLVGHIALESRRARCMVVGEDLGTVAAGFRDRMMKARILGMRVLWFEREGARFAPPSAYPPLSAACVSTHDLPTLAGWWRGTDIAELLSLGLRSLTAAGEAIAARREEKHILIAALIAAGLLEAPPAEDDPLDDPTAAAIHAFVGDAGSALASAQLDDLVGEAIATNLPGTDRERPNWRIRTDRDVASVFAASRARAILAALARRRS